MLHVELLPDPAVETAVRADWDRLEEAGLPNLSRHRSPSNRPHVTVSIHADETSAAPALLAPRLAPLLTGPPLGLRLGTVGVFGSGSPAGFVLVRTVVVTSALLRLHAGVLDVLGPPCVEHCALDAWVPHVTLARRLPAEQVGRALDVLGPVPDGRLVSARLWDSSRRETTDLGPVGTPPDGRREG